MSKKTPKALRTRYILYKVERDIDTEQVIDLDCNSYEFTSKDEIARFIHASKRDILTMINTRFTDNLKTFRDYTIIMEKSTD